LEERGNSNPPGDKPIRSRCHRHASMAGTTNSGDGNNRDRHNVWVDNETAGLYIHGHQQVRVHPQLRSRQVHGLLPRRNLRARERPQRFRLPGR
jgi:hypothetical protein